MTEADIQRDILAYLHRRSVLHTRLNAGKVSNVRLAPKGWSDIIGCYKGRFMAIEVKDTGGKLTEDQIAFLLRVRDEGGIAVVARSVEDVARALEGR